MNIVERLDKMTELEIGDIYKVIEIDDFYVSSFTKVGELVKVIEIRDKSETICTYDDKHTCNKTSTDSDEIIWSCYCNAILLSKGKV